ncbi:hypothetical protein GCM10018782_55880 [Streptomyces griseoaurantiacus]|nr:hypothetical protein GCM10018782_55880 [Streptomyces griseoaurantiacus]
MGAVPSVDASVTDATELQGVAHAPPPAFTSCNRGPRGRAPYAGPATARRTLRAGTRSGLRPARDTRAHPLVDHVVNRSENRVPPPAGRVRLSRDRSFGPSPLSGRDGAPPSYGAGPRGHRAP